MRTDPPLLTTSVCQRKFFFISIILQLIEPIREYTQRLIVSFFFFNDDVITYLCIRETFFFLLNNIRSRLSITNALENRTNYAFYLYYRFLFFYIQNDKLSCRLVCYMGNLQAQCRGKTSNLLEIDRPQAIYQPNETVSGNISYLKYKDASIVLTGIITFKKRKRNGLEKTQIKFFSTEIPLSINSKQNFQLQLDDHLPPSFNDMNTYPNISYSINLLSGKAKEHNHLSIPIYICPRTTIDRPLLLTPLFFGPIENQSSGLKLEVKVNRAVFTFDDLIQIYYELQNPKEENIQRTEISLGIYYLIESNVWQNDVCNGIENSPNTSSNSKLIRNKALLNIPQKTYLPPTYKFQYGHESDNSSFHLAIDYKIQLKIYFGETESLWQVDIPIVICGEKTEQMDIIKEDFVVENNDNDVKNNLVSEIVNITE